MKHCPSCDTDKELDDFSDDKYKADGKASFCKECRRNKANAKREASPEHQAKTTKYSDERRRRMLAIVQRYKRMKGCSFCSEREPVCLDFHHLNPEEKDFSPSSAMRYSKQKIKNELSKCIIVCACCHRKIHAGIISLVV